MRRYNHWRLPAESVRRAAEPLAVHLARVDGHIDTLYRQGGDLAALEALACELRRPIPVRAAPDDAPAPVSLAEPRKLEWALWDISPTLRLGIQSDRFGLPRYRLVRLVSARGGAAVVEELHRSPRYHEDDRRLATFNVDGRARLYLDLSGCRADAARVFGTAEPDDTLCAGARVLREACHQDQVTLAVLAEVLALPPHVLHLTEALYLCLGDDLGRLRERADAKLERFLDVVRPQPLIAELLRRAAGASGKRLARLAGPAKELYAALYDAFLGLADVSVPWGLRSASRVPLLDALHASWYCRDALLPLREQPAVQEGVAALRDAADVIAGELLEAVG